jgi:hypothetical protein
LQSPFKKMKRSHTNEPERESFEMAPEKAENVAAETPSLLRQLIKNQRANGSWSLDALVQLYGKLIMTFDCVRNW